MFVYLGKKISQKLTELETRIEKLEKQVKESVYSTLLFDCSSSVLDFEHEKTITFTATKESAFTLKVDLKASNSAVVQGEIILNGVLLRKITLTGGMQKAFDFDGVATEGENTVKITLSAGVEYYLPVFNAVVSGFVSYQKKAQKLSRAVYGDKEYVLYQCGNETNLYEYSLSGGMVLKRTFKNVIDSAVAGVIGGELYLLTLENSNDLCVRMVNLSTMTSLVASLGVTGVQSVAGYVQNDSVVVYFTKLYDLKTGVYKKGETFNFTSLGRKGETVSVYGAEPSVYFLGDKIRGAKMVEINSATYTLGSVTNCHAVTTPLGYNVFYNQGGKIYKRTLENGTLTARVEVGFYDEYLPLSCGKILKRQRDNLAVSEE